MRLLAIQTLSIEAFLLQKVHDSGTKGHDCVIISQLLQHNVTICEMLTKISVMLCNNKS